MRLQEKGVVCTQWDIYDSYKNKEEAEKDDDSDSILDDVEINQNSNKDLAVKVAGSIEFKEFRFLYFALYNTGDSNQIYLL